MDLRRWFGKRPSAGDMHEELEAHLQMRAAHDGSDEAAARRRFGNLLKTQEAMRRVWIAAFLDTLMQDARYTWRSWRRNPGFALTAVAVLALGLGASTAMFSALDRILFRPLPYANADRLVSLGWTLSAVWTGPGRTQTVLSSQGYRERWKPAPEPFTAVTTVSHTEGDGSTCDVTEQPAERLVCPTVESNFLETLGVRPALGRDFTPEDDVRGAPAVAIISHDVWMRRFDADPSIFSAAPGANGRTIEVDGSPIPVIGVLPAGFAMPGGEADLLRPQQIYPLSGPPDFPPFLTAFGRMKPGVTPEQAQAAVAPHIMDNAKPWPGYSRDAPPRVVALRDYLVGDAARVAWLLLGAVAGLLLIACVNVANLILARLAARTREFAVRSALGAGGARLARLALTESVLLAVAGGGLGVLFAAMLLRVFVQLAPSSIPEIDHASLDLRVVSVAALMALAAGAAVGIWPALAVLRSRARQYGMRATATARPRMRFTLVTLQIALTVAMLGGSALLLRTLWNLVSVPLGYQSERVVTMTVALNSLLYPNGTRDPFFERLLTRIREIPGTAAVTMTSAVPPAGTLWKLPVYRLDRGRPFVSQPRQQRVVVRVRAATPGYFQIFGIPILRGRAFVEADRGPRPAVILSESAAQVLFPGQDPLGHTVQLMPVDRVQRSWAKPAEVVGIARGIRNTGPALEPEPEIYASGWTDNSSTAYFAIRTQAGAAAAAAFLRQAVAELDPALPVTIEPADAQVARFTERPRFVAWLLSAFAGLALLLAAAGLYGVASYLVTQRTRDIGVRMALGATPGGIARQIVSEAGRWIAAGALGGTALAWAVARTIESQLYQVGAADPVSWAVSLSVFAAALLAAVLRPASRAAHIDPIAALRQD